MSARQRLSSPPSEAPHGNPPYPPDMRYIGGIPPFHPLHILVHCVYIGDRATHTPAHDSLKLAHSHNGWFRPEIASRKLTRVTDEVRTASMRSHAASHPPSALAGEDGVRRRRVTEGRISASARRVTAPSTASRSPSAKAVEDGGQQRPIPSARAMLKRVTHRIHKFNERHPQPASAIIYIAFFAISVKRDGPTP